MKQNIKKEEFITFYDKMLSESKRLGEKINSLESQLASCPEGKLVLSRTENRYKWYQSDGHQKTYIPKKNRALAEQLATKKYLLNLDVLRYRTPNFQYDTSPNHRLLKTKLQTAQSKNRLA